MVLDKRRVLFVGGIPSSMVAEVIREHFSKYDSIVSVRIMKDRLTKTSKGYAYVTVADHKKVPLILSENHVIAGRSVDVQLASRRGEKKQWKEDQKRRKLFVSNIPNHVDNEALSNYFSSFGPVRNAYVIRDFLSKASLNYGYVEFYDPSSSSAVLETPSVMLDGCELVCLPFQGRFQENTFLEQHQPKGGYYEKRFYPDEFSESSSYQQNRWPSDSNNRKATKYYVRVSHDTPFKRERFIRPRNLKYEFIGVSSRLNQDESNYRFRIKLEKDLESLNCYSRALMSLCNTVGGPTKDLPHQSKPEIGNLAHLKSSLSHGIFRSDTMVTNSPTGLSFRNQNLMDSLEQPLTRN